MMLNEVTKFFQAYICIKGGPGGATFFYTNLKIQDPDTMIIEINK